MNIINQFRGSNEVHIVGVFGESPVIERLANLAIDEKPLSDEAIHGIEEALEDIKDGRLHSDDEILKEFDLK